MPKTQTLLEASFIGGLVLFAVCVGIQSLAFSGRFSPDSVIYVDMAENIAAGEGITSSIVRLGSHVELPVPVTWYAPLYPALLTSGIWLGFDTASFALLVAAAGLGLLLLVSYLTLKNIFDAEPAMFGTALLPAFGPVVVAAESAWSETLGLTFLMLTFWCLAKSTGSRQGSEGPGSKWLFLAGLSAGLAYATRYALLPLALLCGFWIVVTSWQHSKNLRRTATNGALFFAGWAIAALPIIGRNVYYAGSFRGGRMDTSQTSLAEAAAQLYETAKATNPQSDLVAQVAFISTAALILAGTWLRVRRRNPRNEEVSPHPANWSAIYLLALWPVVYLVCLIYAKTQAMIDPLGDRLVLPASAVILLLGGAGLARAFRPARFPTVLAAVAIMASSLYVVGPMTDNILRGRATFQNNLWQGPRLPEALVFLEQHVTQGDLVIAEDGLFIPLFLRRTRTVYFPSSETPLAQDLAPYRERYANRQLFLVLGVQDNNLASEEDWHLVFENQDNVIFVARETERRLSPGTGEVFPSEYVIVSAGIRHGGNVARDKEGKGLRDKHRANAHSNPGKAHESLGELSAAAKHYHAACALASTDTRKTTLDRMEDLGVDTKGYKLLRQDAR